MAALTRDILGFKYYRADTEGGNRQKCEQMIQVSVDIMLSGYYLYLSVCLSLDICIKIFGQYLSGREANNSV